jgi:pilus assembly protein Flp/PilA
MTHLFQTLFAMTVTLGDRVEGRLGDLKQRETGASAVEYALLVGALVAAIVAGLAVFGPKLTAAISNIRVS